MSDESPYPRNMGPVDAMFWRLEQERSLRSTTLAVALLDSPPDRERLRAAVARACLRVPRLRQRVVELPPALSTPVWTGDPDFDLDYHLRWIAVPDTGELQPLLDLAASMAMQAFDRSRPLWEFVVVEGLADGRAGLIQKLHHSVGDGIAGLALLAEIYDSERNPVRAEQLAGRLEPLPEEDERSLWSEALQTARVERPRAARRLLRDGIKALGDPVASVRRASDELRSVAGFMSSGPGPLSPILSKRSSRLRFASFRVPDEALKAAANAHGCKFNDAFLSALVGGLELYHQRRHAPVRALRAAIPVSLRSTDAAAAAAEGNRLAIAQFEAPLTQQDAGRRMRTIRSLLQKQREPASLGAFEVIAHMVNLLPLRFVLPLVLEEMRKSDFVATALTGPSTPFYVAGSRVESLLPFGPTAGAALNVTLLSYTDHASVGVTMDAAAVPDPALLVECLQQGFEEVLKLPGSGVAEGREPIGRRSAVGARPHDFGDFESERKGQRMRDIEIPNFGEVLATHLRGVPQDAYPYLLSQLERTAAARYREWASRVPAHEKTLLECAAREDEIAERAEALFAPSSEHRAMVEEIIPAAKATYYEVFEGYEPFEQMTIQANAERQGASAWQALKTAHPAKAAQLDELSEIELKSADDLDRLLSEMGGPETRR